MESKLIVDLGERSYPIEIGPGMMDSLSLFKEAVCGTQVLIVSNETIAPLYLEKIKSALSVDFTVDEVILPDGEQYKNLQTLSTIYDELIAKKHNRTTTLIALGGGVVGDMTGYAAASYQRGVSFIQVPTTLLSQVDSSVGGKTGVNHPQGKNMIGAFHQPQLVVIDTETLSTLPERELSAGLAEVIKYGLIGDDEFFTWLEEHIDKLLTLDNESVVYAVQRSCQNKADIVAQDEKESGVRALLNLGHTFGHAIESFENYKGFLHGEAVAIGTMIAAELSKELGDLKQGGVERIKTLFQRAKLPTEIPSAMTVNDFMQRMKIDKKVLNGKLRLILLKGIGSAYIAEDVSVSKIEAAIEACRS